tara:strand:+ start:572 stop:2149 length:1578 start_codon:yes stop_codon:yes gene_type:complete
MSETNLQLFPGVFRSTQGGANPDFFLHSSGRVGIGNDAPEDKPTWSSNNNDRNKLNVTGHTHIDGNLNVTGLVYGDGSNMTGVTLPWGQSTPNMATDIKYEGGNVGIGGVAGAEALTVYGDLNLKSGGQLKLNGQTAIFSNWTSHADGIYRTTNVGIGGVPSATHKLKVHGTVEATSFSGIQASDVPGLEASKITSGTLDAGRIPGLEASKITSGTLDAGRIPSSFLSSASGTWSGNLSGSGFVNISGYRNRRPYGPSQEYWKVELANGYFEHGEQGFTDDDTNGPYLAIGIESRYSIHSKEQLFVTSDKRTKTNIRSMDTDVCLEHVNNLNPVSYNKISQNGNFTAQVGLIAQEVENNLPTSIMTNVATLPNILLYGTLSNRVYIDVVDDDGEKHEAIKFDLTVKNGNLNHLTDKEFIGIDIEGKKSDFIYDKSICGDIQNNGTSLSVCLPKHKEKEIPHKDIFDDVWIEGTEVNDVKSLDYNQIFCVLMGAVKEIDKQRKQDKIGFESQLSQLMSRIEALEGS